MAARIVLTGAAGFVGSAILRALVQRGYPTLLLLRNPARLPALPAPIQAIDCDLAQITPEVKEAILRFKPESLIHSAWLGTENTDRNRPEFIGANLTSMLRLFEIASSAGCRQWIGFGSQAEYSPNLTSDITEDAPTFPDNAYGVGKLAAGHMLKDICRREGMGFAWLRLFASYGKNYKASYVMPYLLDCFRQNRMPVLKTPHAVWDYIHVDDVAAFVVAALSHPQTSGIFNLASGQGFTIAEIALILAGLTEYRDIEGLRQQIAQAPDNSMRRVADITAIKRHFHWHPAISLAEGLRLSV